MSWMKENKNDCKKATFLIEKQQETTLSFVEKTKLKLHLYGCSWCRIYEQQSEKMNSAIANLFHYPSAKAKVMEESYKNKLKNLIIDKLKENEI
jgi:hypothetical protein